MTRTTISIIFAFLIVGISIGFYVKGAPQTDRSITVADSLSLENLENVDIEQMGFDGQGQVWVLTKDDLRLYRGEALVDVFTETDSPALANDSWGTPSF